MRQELRDEEVFRVLARRAARIRSVSAPPEESMVWLAQFPLFDVAYAIALDKLRGAIPLRFVRAVPLCPSYVIGTTTFEGELIAVFSFAALVGVRGWRADPATLVVVEIGHERRCAIDCEGIPRPITVSRTVFDDAQARAATVGAADLPSPGLPVVLVDVAMLIRNGQGGGHGH